MDTTLISRLYEQAVTDTLPALGRWAARTVDALPTDSAAPGYRAYNEKLGWRFPRSNAAERITAFRWLAMALNERRFQTLAHRYADAMIADPVRGIYQGPDEQVRGEVWYWREVGLYMTNYTMRVPVALLDLHAQRGGPHDRELALLSGEALLRAIGPVGIPEAGTFPSPERDPAVDAESVTELERWLPANRVNSRIGHALWPLARLHAETDDPRYRQAADQFANTLARLQHDDGSFGQDFRTDCVAEHESTVKGHFLSYMLYGMAQALHWLPAEHALRSVVRNLSEFVASRVRGSGGWPYGEWYHESTGEAMGQWRATAPDIVPGLASAAQALGEPGYLHQAKMLATQHLMRRLDTPDDPDRDGGVPLYREQPRGVTPMGGHFHFWLILGLKEIEAAEMTFNGRAPKPDTSDHFYKSARNCLAP